MTERITEYHESGEILRCLCGNTPGGDGFYTALRSGEYVSPAIGSGWDSEHIACPSCGRIINQRTWEVVGRAEPGAAERWTATEQAEWEASAANYRAKAAAARVESGATTLTDEIRSILR